MTPVVEVVDQSESQDLTVFVAEQATEVSPLLVTVQALAVTDRDALAKSLEYTAEAKRRIKIIVEKFAKPKKDAHAAWKGIVALETEALALYERVVAVLTPKQTRFLEDERRAVEEAARIANEKAEAERKRQEALAAENLRKAEEARQAGEDAKAAKLEAKAEAQQEKAATVPAYVPAEPAKVAGASVPRPWKATCTDLEALLVAAVTDPDQARRAIARGMLKVEFSQQAGNRQAQQTKNLVAIPGVVFAQTTEIRQGSR